MKRIGNSLRLLARLSDAWLPWLLLMLAVPVLVLLGIGIYALFALDLMGGFLLVLLASAAAVVLPLWWFRWRDRPEPVEGAVAEPVRSLVRPSSAWGDFDLEVWRAMEARIDRQLADEPDWPALRDLALELLMEVADRYHQHDRNAFAFTLPALLRLIEEVSRRYRHLLVAHVPFIERIRLSGVKMLYDHREKARLAGHAWNLYRGVRATTPAGLLAEARTQLLARAFDRLGTDLQKRLKKALLQEVVSVAIDLYSGRFEVDDDAIGASKAAEADRQRMAVAVEPLRVCLLGQVNSGKSTLVNALVARTAAEVSQLPTTDRVEVHRCAIGGAALMHLVDLPGLDGDRGRTDRLLEQVVDCDLVIWLLRASQPARALDRAFLAQLDAWYARPENRARRRPPILWVLSQVDRLKPLEAWNPPYHPERPSTPKEQTIAAALAHNRKVMGIDELLPLAIPPGKEPWNLDELRSRIARYWEEGTHAQLNRRRLEAGSRLELKEQARRVGKLGRALFGRARGKGNADE